MSQTSLVVCINYVLLGKLENVVLWVPFDHENEFFLYSLLSFLLVFLNLPNGPNEKNCKRRGWVREKQKIVVEKLLFNPKLRRNKMARKANRQFLLSFIFFQVFSFSFSLLKFFFSSCPNGGVHVCVCRWRRPHRKRRKLILFDTAAKESQQLFLLPKYTYKGKKKTKEKNKKKNKHRA